MNYVLALVGGSLIGIASATLHLLVGRIAGISGIAGRIHAAEPRERDWRRMFLFGLVTGGAFMLLIAPARFATGNSSQSPILFITAGLLVGFGTRLGSGCTSGHGVCGLSRFSQRSLLATLTFIVSGILTVAIFH